MCVAIVRATGSLVSRVGVVAIIVGALPMRGEGSPKSTSEAQRQRAEPLDRSGWTLKQEAQANECARTFLGPAPEETLHFIASPVTLTEDNTPYLESQLIGKPLWHVVLRDFSLRLESSPRGLADKYVRTWDIYLDPVSGRLLKLRSRWPKGEAPMEREPNAELAAKQMRRAGGEIYHGFPRNAPKASFLDALDGMQRDGGNPLIAKQIVAQYVMRSTGGGDPMPVWAITLRGVPPFRSHPGMPQDARYEYRYIVDSETGKWISLSNIPRPAPSDADSDGSSPMPPGDRRIDP